MEKNGKGQGGLEERVGQRTLWLQLACVLKSSMRRKRSGRIGMTVLLLRQTGTNYLRTRRLRSSLAIVSLPVMRGCVKPPTSRAISRRDRALQRPLTQTPPAHHLEAPATSGLALHCLAASVQALHYLVGQGRRSVGQDRHLEARRRHTELATSCLGLPPRGNHCYQALRWLSARHWAVGQISMPCLVGVRPAGHF